MTLTKDHVLPDVLAPNLKVVFCGSAVGRRSAQLKLSYAGPGNKFWPSLYKAGFTPTQWGPTDFLRLPEIGYGLTDLNKTEFGADTDLSKARDDPAALRRKMLKYQPRVLAFTAKRPAQSFLGHPVAYGWQEEAIGATRLYVLTSPSGRAGAFWDLEPWRALAAAVSS